MSTSMQLKLVKDDQIKCSHEQSHEQSKKYILGLQLTQAIEQSKHMERVNVNSLELNKQTHGVGKRVKIKPPRSERGGDLCSSVEGVIEFREN